MERKEILKVIVGSQAHGLARPDSDFDYRAVYIDPTSKILSLEHKYKGSSMQEGEEDNTAYEIGHFLQLAKHNNPTIMEVFKAPIVASDTAGHALRQLFKYCYNPEQAYNAFVGYSLNQRKKLLDNKDNRKNKFACAYIRTLYNLIELLECGDFQVRISNKHQLDVLLKLKYEDFTMGYVIDIAEGLQNKAKELLPKAKSEYNPDKINEFLLSIRKNNW